jgi:glucose/arabinose dehydrogenase
MKHPSLGTTTLGLVLLGGLGLLALHPPRPASAPAPAVPALAPPLTARLELVTDQLTLPTALVSDAPDRLYVCEQPGRIRLIAAGKLQAEPVLDLQKVVVKSRGYDERGLLGLALHPDFARNRKFYVYYSARTDDRANHKSVIEEFRMKTPTQADPGSGRVVLAFDEPEANHNGGDLAFGPDGFLYVTTGDGGGANDRHGSIGNGQNLNTLLGKILRIDVNKSPYNIPADNPFAHRNDARPEIYAYGLRNPWRFSFDRQTGRLFVGDVGQNLYEEVDIIQKGGNYGWRIREAFHPFDEKQKAENLIEPIVEYPHGPEGISVAGGYVYRGKALPQLVGKYIFGDYIGPTYYLTEDGKGTWTRGPLRLTNRPDEWQVYAFGQDAAGELYVLAVLQGGDKGVLYRVGKE